MATTNPTLVRIVGMSTPMLLYRITMFTMVFLILLGVAVLLGNQQQQYRESLVVKHAVETQKRKVEEEGVKCALDPAVVAPSASPKTSKPAPPAKLEDFAPGGITRFELPPPKKEK